MEKINSHWGMVPRVLPAALPVHHIGLTRKGPGDRIAKAFDNCNVSLVLDGAGSYATGGREWRVEAPTAFVELPGVAVDYGPDADGWTELFLIYAPEVLGDMVSRGLVDPDRPCWRITSPRFGEAVQELTDLLRSRPIRGHADRVDAAALRVIAESLLGGRLEGRTPADELVRRLRRRIEQDPRADHDLEALARETGLSATHFRRLWKEQVGVPPARHLANLRLRRACRDLVETDGAVGTIAAALGYEDQLYFARRFRGFTGMSPTQYRERYRQTPG